MDRQAFIKNGAITIVAFGDSFTYAELLNTVRLILKMFIGMC